MSAPYYYCKNKNFVFFYERKKGGIYHKYKQKEVMPVRLKNKTVLVQKFKESLAAVLPITLIVFVLCFYVVSVPSDILMAFVVGAVLLILGMSLFTLGTDLSMTPVGEYVGSAMTKTRKLWLIIILSVVLGGLITVSEPDLQVLAEQVPDIPNSVIVAAVAAGVGLFLAVAMLRIIFSLRLTHMLVILYAVVFVMAFFVPDNFLSVVFDSGGVTTGPMTVPFIMALGVGVSSIRADKNAENDSFGLVALCSVGPIAALSIFALIFKPGKSEYTPVEIPDVAMSRELWKIFTDEIPKYLAEVALALLPVMLFFLIFQLFMLRLKKDVLIRIGIGFLYTYAGLVLFLCGVNVGFMPVGNYIGRQLGALDYNWIIVPIGMIIGYFIVAAEPAVHVLNKQVYEITSGTIPSKALSISLSVSVSLSVGLSMLRIVAGIPIMYILIPGYLAAIVLSFFVPPIFTAIAFDSGGVASGPMTATFLLPLAMGVSTACGRDVVTYAFGVVATVAMTPLITIQVLGLIYKIKENAQKKNRQKLLDEQFGDSDIIEMEDDG